MDQRQKLVDQRSLNGQTVEFVADRMAEMADQAERLAKKEPGWAALAAAERARRETLMEVAREEERLATAINLRTEDDRDVAAEEREIRKDLLELARAEGHAAEELMQREAEDPVVGVLAEQAERNRQLLRHVALTATEADRALRAEADQGSAGHDRALRAEQDHRLSTEQDRRPESENRQQKQ